MSSSNWNSFYESYFGDPYMAWHDGLDERALLALEGDERERAEKLLLDAVGSGDSRPASGLASLRSQTAVPKLKQEMHDATGTAAVNAAHALWQTEHYMPAAYALINLLNGRDFWSVRMDAARALRTVSTPAAISALWNAAENDSEDLVRHHAAASLLSMYNIPSEIYDMHPLSIDVMSEDKNKQEQALHDLKQLIQEKGHLTEQYP